MISVRKHTKATENTEQRKISPTKNRLDHALFSSKFSQSRSKKTTQEYPFSTPKKTFRITQPMQSRNIPMATRFQEFSPTRSASNAWRPCTPWAPATHPLLAPPHFRDYLLVPPRSFLILETPPSQHLLFAFPCAQIMPPFLTPPSCPDTTRALIRAVHLASLSLCSSLSPRSTLTVVIGDCDTCNKQKLHCIAFIASSRCKDKRPELVDPQER